MPEGAVRQVGVRHCLGGLNGESREEGRTRRVQPGPRTPQRRKGRKHEL